MDNVHLSTTIKALCKSQNITVKKLLEGCRVSRNFIYDLEKKGQMPSIDKLEAIADYLDCSVDYLLGRKMSLEIEGNGTEALLPTDALTPSQQKLVDYALDLSNEELKETLDFIGYLKAKRSN